MTLKASLPYSIEQVWDIVTSLEHYAWRSDLDHIEVQDAAHFTEITKDGYRTAFTITAREPYTRYEFDMENTNMHGHWTGLFSEQDGMTVIAFTEDVTARKLLMKPFVRAYLQKQQAAYLSDLRKELETNAR